MVRVIQIKERNVAVLSHPSHSDEFLSRSATSSRVSVTTFLPAVRDTTSAYFLNVPAVLVLRREPVHSVSSYRRTLQGAHQHGGNTGPRGPPSDEAHVKKRIHGIPLRPKETLSSLVPILRSKIDVRCPFQFQPHVPSIYRPRVAKGKGVREIS